MSNDPSDPSSRKSWQRLLFEACRILLTRYGIDKLERARIGELLTLADNAPSAAHRAAFLTAHSFLTEDGDFLVYELLDGSEDLGTFVGAVLSGANTLEPWIASQTSKSQCTQLLDEVLAKLPDRRTLLDPPDYPEADDRLGLLRLIEGGVDFLPKETSLDSSDIASLLQSRGLLDPRSSSAASVTVPEWSRAAATNAGESQWRAVLEVLMGAARQESEHGIATSTLMSVGAAIEAACFSLTELDDAAEFSSYFGTTIHSLGACAYLLGILREAVVFLEMHKSEISDLASRETLIEKRLIQLLREIDPPLSTSVHQAAMVDRENHVLTFLGIDALRRVEDTLKKYHWPVGRRVLNENEWDAEGLVSLGAIAQCDWVGKMQIRAFSHDNQRWVLPPETEHQIQKIWSSHGAKLIRHASNDTAFDDLVDTMLDNHRISGAGASMTRSLLKKAAVDAQFPTLKDVAAYCPSPSYVRSTLGSVALSGGARRKTVTFVRDFFFPSWDLSDLLLELYSGVESDA